MKKNKLIIFLTSALVIFLMWFLFTAISIQYYSKKYFDKKSDVAIVLGAGTNKGKISKIFEKRILHAIDLFKKKRVQVIIFTGGYGIGQTISDSKAAKMYAIRKGVPANKILIEEESTITFYNLKNAKMIMVQYNLSSALLVSDPYHMMRSINMCESIGIDALPSPTPITMFKSRKTKFDFLIQETFNFWGYQLAGHYRNLN